MLLFVCGTSENVIDVFDADTLEMKGRIKYNNKLHNVNIGPRAGADFKDKVAVAGCYDNTISIIDKNTFCEVKAMQVGAYPISLASDERRIYIACGDCNSIWTIQDDFEVVFIDSTVEFPFCIAVSKTEICVCGFTYGEICVYDKNSFEIKDTFNVGGYPHGIGYLKEKPIISFNKDEKDKEGGIYYGGKVVNISKRVGKLMVVDDKVFICADDSSIFIMDSNLDIKKKIFLKEPVADFTASQKWIFTSTLLGGKIKKFSHNGEESGSIKVEYSGASLFLSF